MWHMLLFVQAIILAYGDPELGKQGTADRRKHITLTILQKLKIIRGIESGKSQKEIMASYGIGSSALYDIK